MIRTEGIPVTVDMLTGLDPIDLYVPGDKTCTLMYDGKVLTDHYTLRLTAGGNEHPAVTKPVKLTDGTETVYQRTNQLVVGQSYVFVDTNTKGSAHMMAVTLQEDGTYAIEAIDVETIQGKNDVLVLARNDGVLWQFEENTNHYRTAVSAYEQEKQNLDQYGFPSRLGLESNQCV